MVASTRGNGSAVTSYTAASLRSPVGGLFISSAAAVRRLTTLLCLVALFACVVACGGSKGASEAQTPPAVQHKLLKFEGLSRSYRLYAPLSLERGRPAPLVLVLAGVGNTGDSMVEATRFDRLAESAGFLVAYPDGVNNTWNAGY